MIKRIDKNKIRLRKHVRVRKKISGTAERPRLCVYRSLKHIYAQVIDDVSGTTLVAA
ncbi:MAG TPA: 50S ribosomal protein L18, partial [Clostridiaceae bacterium]|nr:50S ribosomal protein L18 [Clostridiaceae bacterium]